MGEKRIQTKPGVGAVRAPVSGQSHRRVAITCPSLKRPVLEDVSERGVDSARRPDTLRRVPSSDRKIRAVTPIVSLAAIPRATQSTAPLAEQDLEPSDLFLLSRLDGELSVADLADLMGMLPKDVVASLARLLRAGLVETS